MTIILEGSVNCSRIKQALLRDGGRNIDSVEIRHSLNLLHLIEMYQKFLFYFEFFAYEL